jgi:hypothetical protein
LIPNNHAEDASAALSAVKGGSANTTCEAPILDNNPPGAGRPAAAAAAMAAVTAPVRAADDKVKNVPQLSIIWPISIASIMGPIIG